MDMVRVLEPAPDTATDQIAGAIAYLRTAWHLTEPKTPSGEKK